MYEPGSSHPCYMPRRLHTSIRSKKSDLLLTLGLPDEALARMNIRAPKKNKFAFACILAAMQHEFGISILNAVES